MSTVPMGCPMSMEEAARILAEVPLPPLARAIAAGAAPPPVAQFRCQPPFVFFSQGVLAPVGAAPLWGHWHTITAWMAEPREWISFSLEAPDEITRYPSFAAMVAALLIGLWEDEAADDELRAIAADLDFERIDELFAALTAGCADVDELAARFR